MFRSVILVLGLAAFAAAQTGVRALNGIVIDKRGNALPGAVVYLENTNDLSVRTYITDKTGHYVFNDMTENADYTIIGKYRRWRSETKTLSKFDSAAHPEIKLTIPID